MRLLSRYILRQLAAPFVFAIAAMTSLMVLNQIAKRFGALVGKGLPASVIGEVFLLSLPFIVAMTLPMAVLLAVLYAFTTLAGNNEITAMRASGVSVGQILRPVFLAGALLTVADFAFVDQGLPAANLRLKARLYDIQRKRPTLNLEEQALNPVPPSPLFLRAGRIDPAAGRLRDVTIYDMTRAQGRQVVYADSGRMGFTANQADLYLTLYNGSILQFKGEDPGLFQLTYFTVNTIRVKGVGNALERSEDLVAKSDREMTTCEMLDLVADTTRSLEHQEAIRSARLEADLRALLSLPAARPDTASAGEAAAGSRFCGWLRGVGRRLLPETAEAQRPAQGRTDLPAWKRLQIERAKRGVLPDSGAPATATRPTPAAPVARATREVALTPWVEVANTAEGIQASTKTAGSFRLEVHKKYAISVACLVFVLVGIPLALRFPRGGMGLVLGGGTGIFALYYVSLTGGEPLADAGKLSPVVAMWAPNVVFTLLGIAGLVLVNRELGSTRGGDVAELGELLRRVWRRGRRR